MKFLQVATAAALGGCAMLAAPAHAQPVGVPEASPAFVLAPAERAALAPLSQAVSARNWPAAIAALQAAQAGARSQNGRYALGRLQLDVGVGTQNRQLQAAGVETIIDSGVAGQQESAVLLRHQAGLAFEEGAFERAERALTRMAQVSPNDPEALAMLALVSRNRNNIPQAINSLNRSLEVSEASGRRAPESRYKVALATALQARARSPGIDLARRLVEAYPSAINWRDAMLATRELSAGGPAPTVSDAGAGAAAAPAADPVVTLETMRLARAAGALSGERDYLAMAAALIAASLPGEAKAVLDEGVTRGMLTPTDSAVRSAITTTNTRATADRAGLAARVTAARAVATGRQARVAGDSLYGYGRHAEAAEMYRLALTKTGEDANLVNMRLGASLALAGQRPEAEAALRLVTGERAELARFWLAWLARPAA